MLPAAVSRPCLYGAAAAPRERAGPGQAGRGNRAATCASRRGSPGCPGPICLFLQSAGCPASAARMW